MNNKYKNLELVSGEEGCISTGVDCKLTCDGKDLIEELGLCNIDWEISEKDGLIELYTNLGKGKIKINYPVKSITIYTKGFTIKSDNTSLGTKVYCNGEDITSKWSISSLKYSVGDANTISELEMIVA